MEFLSDKLETSEKYRAALDRLEREHPGWQVLVQLNNMILKYGVHQWKKDLMPQKIKELSKNPETGKNITVKELKASLHGRDGVSKAKKGELLKMRAHEELREEWRDQKNDFDRDELISFLDENRKVLQSLITSIRPGDHGLLRISDIVDIDHRFYHEDARAELINFANPLYTVYALTDYRLIGLDNGRQHHTLNNDIIQLSDITLESMRDHGLEIARILLWKIFIVNVLNHASNVNPIINIILSANQSTIQTNLGGGVPMDADNPAGQKLRLSNYSINLFTLLIQHGLMNHSFAQINNFDVINWHYSGDPADMQRPPGDMGSPVNVLRQPVYGTSIQGDRTTLYNLCEPGPHPHGFNPGNVPSIRGIWMDIINLQKAQKNLVTARGYGDEGSLLSELQEPDFVKKISRQIPVGLTNRHSSISLRRQNVSEMPEIKGRFEAEKNLSSAKVLYSDKSLLSDLDVAEKVKDEYIKSGQFPHAEKKMIQEIKDISRGKAAVPRGEAAVPRTIEEDQPLAMASNSSSSSIDLGSVDG